MKPVLNNFMRRLDKSLTKIHKNQRIYVSTDWSAVSTLLRGLYQVILASHWSRVILRPDTGLSLVQSDHLTWILPSYWSRVLDTILSLVHRDHLASTLASHWSRVTWILASDWSLSGGFIEINHQLSYLGCVEVPVCDGQHGDIQESGDYVSVSGYRWDNRFSTLISLKSFLQSS